MGRRLNNTKINRNVQAVSLPFPAENLDGPEAGLFECHGMPRGVFLYFSGGDEHPAALGQAVCFSGGVKQPAAPVDHLRACLRAGVYVLTHPTTFFFMSFPN